MAQYHITSSDEGISSAFIVFADGTATVVPHTHPGYAQIVEALLADSSDEDRIRRLADVKTGVKAYLSLSERVTMRGKKVYFDGDRVRGPIVKHIIRMMRDDSPHAGALVQFLEKVSQNPSAYARDVLYNWLDARHFTITPDGDFIAYKGVTGEGLSIIAGTARVDGVEVVGQIPNEVGSVVTMPRSTVDDGHHIACSTGLHVGTYDFAHDFSQGRVVTVKVNPRDVVSVPSDSGWQKMRVCRYLVLEVADAEISKPVHGWYDEYNAVSENARASDIVREDWESAWGSD